jgi:putative nucleotidyltransferase with HDIG domain
MTAIALVQKVKDLPPVPEAALKLISLLEKFAVDNNEIIQVLKYDNVLTARLLQACNAPAFGLGEPVESVDQAVFILGHEQILHLVMTLAFKSVMTGSSKSYTMDMNQLWHHSVVSAIGVEIVLEQIPALDGSANVAFTTSLLHDIGKLVFAQTLTADELAEIRDRIERKQISCVKAEKEFLGIDHSEVGAALLKKWRLPESIVEGVANHHYPPIKPEPRLSTLVHIANSVAHHTAPSPGQTPDDRRLDDGVAAAFNINEEKMNAIVEVARKSLDKVDRFMAIG